MGEGWGKERKGEGAYSVPRRKMPSKANLRRRLIWRPQTMGIGRMRIMTSPKRERQPLMDPLMAWLVQ